jgi:nucleoside 2-deoxyribosyltransferase
MSGKSGLADNTKDGGITDIRLNPGDIIHRDFQDVMRSDLILANLNLWGSPRPMLGTWPELGWAWEHKKPVIAISTPGDSNYDLVRSHPFVRAFVAHYFDTVEEAAEFIESYYVRP